MYLTNILIGIHLITAKELKILILFVVIYTILTSISLYIKSFKKNYANIKNKEDDVNMTKRKDKKLTDEELDYYFKSKGGCCGGTDK